MGAQLSIYLWVALGGSIGAVLRYFLSQSAVSLFGKQFPFGTLIVNVTGAFLIAIVYGLIERGVLESLPYRFFIGVGLLGALTTFSTFSIETFTLLDNGMWLKAIANVLLNVLICLLATFVGVQLVKG